MFVRKWRITSVCVLGAFVVIGGLWMLQIKKIISENEDRVRQSCTIPMTDVFYDAQLFAQSVERAQISLGEQKPIRGVIMPHHLLASDIIADLFTVIKQQNPQEIILIGPDHYEKGKSVITTSECGWETPYGPVSVVSFDNMCDMEAFVSCDREMLLNEHSMGALMPYVSYYTPEAHVAPFVVSQKITTEQQEQFAQRIAAYTQEHDALVLLSTDFSHYLSVEDAQRMDRETREAVKNFSLQKIRSYDSDHVDTPQGLAIFLRVMQIMNTTKNIETHHTNSATLLRDPFAQTTSYFGMIYTDK